MSSHSSAVRTGSRPESGSSKSTMSGSSTSARANPARLRIPPDSSLGILSPASARPTSRRRRLTISPISCSPLAVCWRSGKHTLSKRFIEPKSAPSWKRTPNFLRISNSSSSCMFGTDSPWTRMSPSSGYSRPTMCLMHTDLPVPDGPRIIEILSSGRPMFRPRRILLRPNALWTSTNSIASVTPAGRSRWPLCSANSSSSPSGPGSLTTETREGSGSSRGSRSYSRSRSPSSSPCVSQRARPLASVGCSSRRSVSSLTSLSASNWRPGVRPPEHLCSQHPDEVHQHDVQHHRLRRRRADAHRAAARVVAVVTADEHDGRRHDHALDHAVQEVWWVLEHPEDQEEPSGRDLADLLDHREVAGEEAGADGGDVHERQDHPRGEQAGGAQEQHGVDAHDLERVDLVGDPHRAQLRHQPRAHLRGHHVAERVRHELAQVAPRGEHARVRGRALRTQQVRALDPALQPGDEHQAPDHDRRGDDQDAGLAQRLAEEAQHAPAEHERDDPPAEGGDLAEPLEASNDRRAHSAG